MHTYIHVFRYVNCLYMCVHDCFDLVLSTVDELNAQLDGWLHNAPASHCPARAIIAP